MIIKGIPAYWKITNNKREETKKADLKCIMLKTELTFKENNGISAFKIKR
jgi:hypothetical protein